MTMMRAMSAPAVIRSARRRCRQIDALIGQGAGMLLEFSHQNSPGPMNLLSIKCSAPPANFYAACPV